MIFMELKGLPLSVNHAYSNFKGKRMLTKAGRKYKTETSAYLVRTYPTEMQIFKPNTPYGFWVQFQFPDLYNKGWPKKAKSRYKRIDVSNRLKLFEDALFDASGIDDSQVMIPVPEKVEGPEYTRVWVWNMEEECPLQWKP